MIRDPGLPQDPDHPLWRECDARYDEEQRRARERAASGSDCPGGTGPIIRIDSVLPVERECADIPILDWCYLWPLSLGRAAPGARRVRWNGRPLGPNPTPDGPGALWSTEASAHLVPDWAPKVGVQSGISRMGIHRSGGVTGGSVVLVPRRQLLEVAEYADALLATTGSIDHRPSSGYSEWSLGLAGGPTGVWCGVRIESFAAPAARPGDVRRFAEAVDAPWIVDVGRFDGDDRTRAGDRMTVSAGYGSVVYQWDHGDIRLIDPPEIEARLDPADVRSLHDVAAFVDVRRHSGAPWLLDGPD